MDVVTAGMAELLKREKAEWDSRPHRAGFVFRNALTLTQGTSGYPRGANKAERSFADSIFRPRVHLLIFSSRDDDDQAKERLSSPSFHNFNDLGDLAMDAGDENWPLIVYDGASGAIQFTVRGTVEVDDMRRSGTIVSLPDLERGLPMISISGAKIVRDFRPFMRPFSIHIRGRSRFYSLSGEALQRVATWQHQPIYALPRLETARGKRLAR